MSPLCLFALLIASNLSELPVSEREVMALVFRAPTITGDERAQTLDALRVAIEGLTHHGVEDVSALVEDSDDPVRAIIRASASGRRKVPELSLSISLLPAGADGQTQVSWQLVQSREAHVALSRALNEGLEIPSLDEFVVAFELFEVSLSDHPRTLIDPLMNGLEPPLEKLGAWRPHGTLRVELPAEGFVLKLDGRRFEAPSAELELDDVAVGARTLELEHPDYDASSETVRIDRDRVTTWHPALVDRRLREARVPRAVVLATGLGLVAAGGVFLAVAVAQGGASPARCLQVVGDPPCAIETSAFTRMGPVPTAPLGYSLALAGGVMAGGVLLSDASDQPWWWTALGVGLGAAAFAVSVLADGSSTP